MEINENTVIKPLNFHHLFTLEKLANVLAFNLFSSSLNNSISSVYLFALSNSLLFSLIFLEVYNGKIT
jgi:hypothetical protein